MSQTETIDVSGMSCGGCERTVEDALADVEGVERVEANHEEGTVEIVRDDSVSDADLGAAIDEAGYEVVA